jgi:FkbM family methyltransferase
VKASTWIKFGIQSSLRRSGWELRRYSLVEEARLVQFLDLKGIDIVLDVGANVGQFGSNLRQAGFAGTIISFEPQSEAHAMLTRRAAPDPKWKVAPRAAVGNRPGEAEINISANSVSSSLLEIESKHTESAPTSTYVAKEKVPVITLDQELLIPNAGRLFLKIDTQGFERPVLEGARALLKRTSGVLLETSLTSLYKGQASALELQQLMAAEGFALWNIMPGFEDGKTGQLLQADMVFYKDMLA